MLQHEAAFVTEQKFQFAELGRLKARRRIQTVAKTAERQGCQRFHNVDLLDHDFHDGARPLERRDGTEQEGNLGRDSLAARADPNLFRKRGRLVYQNGRDSLLMMSRLDFTVQVVMERL